jgi:hypothetical protein
MPAYIVSLTIRVNSTGVADRPPCVACSGFPVRLRKVLDGFRRLNADV